MSPAKLADRRQRRTRRALFWGLATALVLYFLFVGDHRPHHLALLWLEDRRTEEQIRALRERGAELQARVTSVESDPLALEELARQKGMVRPGDLVYHIVPVPPDVRKAAAESLALDAARQAEADARAEAAAEAARRAGPSPAGTSGARPAAERPATSSSPSAPPSDPRWRWIDESAPSTGRTGAAAAPAAAGEVDSLGLR